MVKAKRSEELKYFKEIGDHKVDCKYYAATYAPETQRWVRESRPAATNCVGYFHRRKTRAVQCDSFDRICY